MNKIIFIIMLSTASLILSGCDHLPFGKVKKLEEQLDLSQEKMAELQKENTELKEKLKSSLEKDKENIKKLFQ